MKRSGGRKARSSRGAPRTTASSTTKAGSGLGAAEQDQPADATPGPSRHADEQHAGAGEVRLQKFLADAGVASRREVERWIAAGRVRVNGRVAQVGDKAKPTDRISVDGRPVMLPRRAARPRVIAYHKPAGEVCTRDDPEGRPTVFERLPRAGRGRWISVGRLDASTSGLLLFTTDGELAARLMHPSTEVAREYAVRVLGEISQAQLTLLSEGVELEDGLAAFESIAPSGPAGANRWYAVVLREGRNREVRRMFEAIGGVVSRLIRVRYGPVELNRRLARGRSEEVTGPMLAALYAAAGLQLPESPKPRAGAPRGPRGAHPRRQGRTKPGARGR
jgi:23S rRNA pseudouridine2605 synthase